MGNTVAQLEAAGSGTEHPPFAVSYQLTSLQATIFGVATVEIVDPGARRSCFPVGSLLDVFRWIMC